MKFSFARPTVTIKYNCNLCFVSQLTGERDTIRISVMRAQMGDHSNDMIFVRPEMECPVTPFGEPHRSSLPLGKQSFKGHTAPGEHAKVAVHGKDILVLRERLCGTN